MDHFSPRFCTCFLNCNRKTRRTRTHDGTAARVRRKRYVTADGDTQLLYTEKKNKMKISRRPIEAIGFNGPLDFSTPPRVRRNNNAAAPTLTRTIVFAGFSECSKRQRRSPAPPSRSSLRYVHETQGQGTDIATARIFVNPSLITGAVLSSLTLCRYWQNTRFNWALIRNRMNGKTVTRRNNKVWTTSFPNLFSTIPGGLKARRTCNLHGLDEQSGMGRRRAYSKV